jgi:hypothetical protein
MGDEEAEGQLPPADEAGQGETTGGPDKPMPGADTPGTGAPGTGDAPPAGGSDDDGGIHPDSIYGG